VQSMRFDCSYIFMMGRQCLAHELIEGESCISDILSFELPNNQIKQTPIITPSNKYDSVHQFQTINYP
jgi:hypothetical protein